jgi:hypothetical protein
MSNQESTVSYLMRRRSALTLIFPDVKPEKMTEYILEERSKKNPRYNDLIKKFPEIPLEVLTEAIIRGLF